MATYFNLTLFKRNMMRFWPLAVVCFIAALLVFVIPEANSQRNPLTLYDEFGSKIVMNLPKNIMTTLSVYCSIVVFPMSILTAIAVFGYLHNSKAAGFISSQPITRLSLYITNWLSALTLMLAPVVLVGTFYGILLIGQPVPQWDFLRWIGALLAAHMIFLSIAVFCTFLTGSSFMQAFLYGMFNFICYALYFAGIAIASMLVFGYSSPMDYSQIFSIIKYLTPPAALIDMIQAMSPQNFYPFGSAGTVQSTPLPWILYLLFTALLIVSGYLLYRRRHIEAAGDILVYKPVKAAIKYLVSLFVGIIMALIITFLIMPSLHWEPTSRLWAWLTVSVMVFGALGCLFAEMLIKKRLHVLKSAYKGIIGFVAAVAAIMLFIRFDGTGYERWVPNRENVVSVSFTNNYLHQSSEFTLHRANDNYTRYHGNNWNLTWAYTESRESSGWPVLTDEILHEIKLRTPDYFESPEGIDAAIRLHRALIDNKTNLDNAREDRGYNRFTYYLTYTMKDGSIINREYGLPLESTHMNEIISLMHELSNQPEAINKRNRFATLPNDSVRGAIVTSTEDDFWVLHTNHEQRNYVGTIVLEKDDLSKLFEALQKDAADGTLGRVHREDILLPFYYIEENSHFVAVVDLVLDSNVAGVPTAFERDVLMDEKGEFIITHGLVQSINITDRNVNTVQALKELGLVN